MSREGLVADRYAGALFNLALKKEALDSVFEEFSALSVFVSKNKNIFQFIEMPTVPLKEKEAFAERVFGDSFSKLFVEFLKTLIRKKRFLITAEIFTSFDKYYKSHKKIKNVEVITAKQISGKAQASLISILEKKLDSKINVQNRVDKNIIGGIVIRFEGKEIDGSFKSRIKEIKSTLLT